MNELVVAQTASVVSTGRTVIVASTAANRAKRIENFTGRTWSELKNMPEIAALIQGNVEAVLNPGNVTLSREDSQLPDGDFKVFLIPTKNDAGMTDRDSAKLGSQVAALIQQGARKASDLDAKELKTDLVNQIQSFFGVDLSEEVAAQERPVSDAIEFDENGEEVDQELLEALREAQSI